MPTNLEQSLVLGRYRVLWRVDETKLIKAYIARDDGGDGSDTPVLIKQFLHHFEDLNSATALGLIAELTALERLRLPGVMTLLGHGIDADSIITAQLHPPGLSLLHLCDLLGERDKPFPAPLAVYIARRLLWTLHQCHTHAKGPFIHGHLTPASIHLPQSGAPEICDFCVARLEDTAAEAETQLGFFHARMSYLAPEVSRGGPVTAIGDTYSMALLLYRLLSGTNPLKGRSVAETLQRVLRHTPEGLHVPGWEHSERADAILTRALSKDPAQRYPSSLALYDALAVLQTGTDAALGEELARLVASTDADWGRIKLLAHSTRRSRENSSSDRSLAVQHFESAKPAFASGLITEQPKSLTEHTRRSQGTAGALRRVGPWLTLAAVVSASMLMAGLFLGRLSGARASGARAPEPVEAESGHSGVASRLRTRLRACTAGDEPAGTPSGEQTRRQSGEQTRPEHDETATLDLVFDTTGTLSEVRLGPAELLHSRRGACLLAEAWKTEASTPGTLSLVLPLAPTPDHR